MFLNLYLFIQSASESTESEAVRLSQIITTTRDIAGKIHDILEATTESDGISEVTPNFLFESERIMTYGNEIRAKVARNPVLAERVSQLQSLTLPPSPPRSKDESGAEGDDEEEAVDGDPDEDEGDDDVVGHANITPPNSQDNNDILACNFPGSENLFVPCTCISNISHSSGFSAEIPGEAGETGVEGTDDDSITFMGNFEGKPKEIKLEPSSDESIICVKHIVHRGKPTMTGTGSYDQLIKRNKANAVANAFKRSRMARTSNSIWCSNPRPAADSMRSPPASTWQGVTGRRSSPNPRQAASASVGPKTSSPKRKLSQETGRQEPSGPPTTQPPQAPQPSTSRGHPIFATAGRQSAEFEASLEAFRDPQPERDPGHQGPFLVGDESFIPYNSDSDNYLSPGSFCTHKGSKVHPPRRERKDK
jgi:hypothetical protein